MNRSRALPILMVAILLAGCVSGQSSIASDEDAVKMTVTRYNRLLAEGYRTMDMGRIREVAEELQSEDEYVHMSALAEGGVRLLPLLKSRTFEDVTIEETSALVETREVWDFKHEDRLTREIILVQEDLVYDLAWDLVRHEDGRWFVSDVRAISTSASVPAQRFADPSSGSGF